jgi:hypothetical protein
VLRWTAAAGFLLAVAVAWWSTEDHLPLVVGGVVVRPLVVGPVVALVATVAAAGGAAAGLAAEEVGAAPGSRRWYVRWPIDLAKAALLGAGWVAAGVAFLMGAAAGDPRLLDPPSPGGCRVLVVEKAFQSTIHLLPAGSFRAVPVRDYLGEAGPAPITLGAHELTWQGETAGLVLLGAQTGYENSGLPDRIALDCRRLEAAAG